MGIIQYPKSYQVSDYSVFESMVNYSSQGFEVGYFPYVHTALVNVSKELR